MTGHGRLLTAREQLRIVLADEPNPCLRWNQTELAEIVGVSRQRVKQILGMYPHVNKSDTVLADFLEQHPEAMLTKARGGMTLEEIGVAIGLSRGAVPAAWYRLGLPPRSLQRKTLAEQNHQQYERHKAHHKFLIVRWRREHPERWYEISRRASARYAAKFLRWERCGGCGMGFPWTQGQEDNMKSGHAFRNGPTCRSACGRQLARQVRDG